MGQILLPGDAGFADVLVGKKFSAGDKYIASGTMANNGAVTITPGTADQAIAAGYHSGLGKVIGDPDLIAPNILSGKDIFGVAGSLIQGKLYATGSGTSSPGFVAFTKDDGTTANCSSLTVSGLNFPNGIRAMIIKNAAPIGSDNIFYTDGVFTGNGSKIYSTAFAAYFKLLAPVVISTTGFTIPCSTGTGSYVWEVWGN